MKPNLTSKILPLLVMLTFANLVFADEPFDDTLIDKIARKKDATVEEVKKSLEEGCSSGITPYMRQCAYYREVGSDIVLNETYSKLMRALNTKSAKQKLIKAQRAWIVFRDASCDFEADAWTGGTGQGVIISGCLETMNAKRNKELVDYKNCKSNGCPGDM